MEESNNYDYNHGLVLLKEHRPIKNFGHQHTLVLLNENHLIGSRNEAGCDRCGFRVSAPCFVCVEDCGFHLHKLCAEAPLQLNHPFHRNHPLLLMKDISFYQSGSYRCRFCGDLCGKLFYSCSCCLNFHIKCALFTFDIAQNNLKWLEHVPLLDPFIPTKDEDEELEDVKNCFGCWEPLPKYTYFSPCEFNLHKKCAELPLKINHRCHRKHPLVLQFTTHLVCVIRASYQESGFAYACSACGLFFHIECLSPPHNIEDKRLQLIFTLFWRQCPFICDACGDGGNHVAYVCVTCDIIVHKKCISLPRVIQSKWHRHRLFHTYFLHRENMGILDCIMCHEEVNTEHGSYYCSKCNDIFHVNCVTKDEDSYVIVEDEGEEPLDTSVNSLIVLEWNDAGDAILVIHCNHDHPLRLSDGVSEHDNKCCDGCLLPISNSFYYYSEYGFYLHKVCAELPKIKRDAPHHRCQDPLVLTSNEYFQCVECEHVSNVFAYKCKACGDYTCFRCIIALTPGARTHPGHTDPLFFYTDYKGQCSACGEGIRGMFRCKKCTISLDHKCFSLPVTTHHKCDEHPLSLNDHDDNNYSESHFCDICEEFRDSNLWFYHCAECDTSAHVKCVLGEYPFIKLGSIIEGDQEHEHPRTLVKRKYYYPNCSVCDKPCLDFALECAVPGCNYIRHAFCPQ